MGGVLSLVWTFRSEYVDFTEASRHFAATIFSERLRFRFSERKPLVVDYNNRIVIIRGYRSTPRYVSSGPRNRTGLRAVGFHPFCFVGTIRRTPDSHAMLIDHTGIGEFNPPFSRRCQGVCSCWYDLQH